MESKKKIQTEPNQLILLLRTQRGAQVPHGDSATLTRPRRRPQLAHDAVARPTPCAWAAAAAGRAHLPTRFVSPPCGGARARCVAAPVNSARRRTLTTTRPGRCSGSGGVRGRILQVRDALVEADQDRRQRHHGPVYAQDCVGQRIFQQVCRCPCPCPCPHPAGFCVCGAGSR
jgi:hypothetical protein